MTDWEKRARELFREGHPGQAVSSYTFAAARELALRLGREMADARAEEIAQALEHHSHSLLKLHEAAAIARATIKKPESKTREQVLEEALRRMPCICMCTQKYGLAVDDGFHESHCPYEIARMALRP